MKNAEVEISCTQTTSYIRSLREAVGQGKLEWPAWVEGTTNAENNVVLYQQMGKNLFPDDR